MFRGLTLISLLAALAAPAAARADTRLHAYDPDNDLARRLTQGITLEARKGLIGPWRLERLFSTRGRASAGLEPVSEDRVLRALPEGADETNVYRIDPEGDGAALGRALCPGADRVWLVAGRIRAVRDMTLHAVGQVRDADPVLCATLEYRWRGEWRTPRQAVDPARQPGALSRMGGQ
ncbi:hypothetical protein Q0812_06895 [Brevundimonas sp. 2R-24]|uniref:Uncharacterized protein n=1 Tax=Peiella sedimenti TaxID=3061083 RepID=A0ABT8SKS3_9CAUL|nr:hypothetical protein [Caulobacteraceae bacterium XZ-24]